MLEDVEEGVDQLGRAVEVGEVHERRDDERVAQHLVERF